MLVQWLWTWTLNSSKNYCSWNGCTWQQIKYSIRTLVVRGNNKFNHWCRCPTSSCISHCFSQPMSRHCILVVTICNHFNYYNFGDNLVFMSIITAKIQHTLRYLVSGHACCSCFGWMLKAPKNANWIQPSEPSITTDATLQLHQSQCLFLPQCH
jgi:hypothetical protein